MTTNREAAWRAHEAARGDAAAQRWAAGSVTAWRETYGFIELDDGVTVHVPARALKKAGIDRLMVYARVNVLVAPGTPRPYAVELKIT
jgi:cold shock CspA family protein